ncbi:MAG: hypothetical protein IT372_01700 [Polyangiaceae bacterium]|nr:hypothetical protein [Polyangiaceae bacterium]
MEQERKLHTGQRILIRLENADTGAVLVAAEQEIMRVPGRMDPASAVGARLIGESSRRRDVARSAAGEAAAGPVTAQIGPTEILEVVRFAWDFIQDNKPVATSAGASTAVIVKGTDPLDYANANEGRSSTYRFYVRDAVFQDWILVECLFRLEGTYLATPAQSGIPFGRYLPSVYFNVLRTYASFGYRLDARAEVSYPANLGPPDDIEPQVRVYAKLTVSTLFSTFSSTAGFVANGKHGFWGTGWE